MKINKAVVLVIFLVSLLAITVASQIPQAATISVEEAKACNTIFYDDIQSVYGNCIDYYNYTDCLNSTGPNTACSLKQIQRSFRCKTGEIAVRKNSTVCNPLNKFTIIVARGSVTEKKEIDFSSWGACIYNNQNNCLVVTCQSRYDGANDGQFHGCTSGTSCQKFEICESKVKVSYKNSRNDFVEEDPTFRLDKLGYREVTK